MNKRFCVLQVTPSEPNQRHFDLFNNKKNSDFYFVTFRKRNPLALKFCPNTVWSETRNTLAELVPKNYDYYLFMDHDMKLEVQGDLDPYHQILEDLEMNPAVMTFYPGKGLETPFANDTNFLKSRDYSCIPFTHNGIKIVHKSLLKWFFPMFTKYRTDTDACHMFNIKEIPFLRNVICSHKIVHHNMPTDTASTQCYNNESAFTKYKMDEMWKEVLFSFKKRSLLKIDKVDHEKQYDSLLIKDFFVNLFLNKNVKPIKQSADVQYFNLNKISKFFNLDHDLFINSSLPLDEKNKKINHEQERIVIRELKKIKFEEFVTPIDPWPNIVKKINNKLGDRKITINQCVDYYQNLEDNHSIFHKNSVMDKDLETFLKNKSVAIVGPSPCLRGGKKGKEIDLHDVVVRIQHNVYCEEDYGTKTDIIQSCLNPNYGDPLVSHLKQIKPEFRPKFIICNDTAAFPRAGEVAIGGLQWEKGWIFNDEIYEDTFKEIGIPLVNLKRKDGKWDRWALYWQVYPKKHIERFSTNSYTTYTANFNSGYGALSFLLRYPLKKLSVYGMDFYNTGIPQTDKEKYNQQYTDTYGSSGRHLGPDKILHDQLSQMIHCKQVLLKDERLKIDKDVLKKLNSSDLEQRLERFKKLPKFKKDTR